jgi:hypothetical protein
MEMANEDTGSGVASNFIWALAMIIIVGMIAAALFYGGFLGNRGKQQIDVDVSAPAAR